MINVSDKFKERMAESRDFRCHAGITLSNGEVLEPSADDFTVGNNSVTDAAGAGTLPLGYAVSRSIGIELLNDADQYADVDFFGAKIRLYTDLALEDTDASQGVNLVLSSDQYISEIGSLSFDVDLSAIKALRGQTVTLSLDVDLQDVTASAASGNHRVGFEPYLVFTDGTTQYLPLWETLSSAPKTKKGRISAVRTVNDKEIERVGGCRIYVQGVGGGAVTVGRPKIEAGSVPAPVWTPAPQDCTERIELGTFTVTEPETYGETVIITAVDDMYRADKPYTTTLPFPATLSAMFRDACTACGIAYSSADFPNGSFVVESPPEGDCTFRDIIGYIAMLAGGNARINRAGRCEILTYDFSSSSPGHELTDWINLRSDTSDTVITGVSTTVTGDDGGEHTVMSGTDGYVISLENPLFAGKEQTAVDLIGERIVGASLRKFEGDMPAYPMAEFMDVVNITDRKGSKYRSVITDMNFVFFGMTTLSCSVESAVRTGSTYRSPTAGVITEARKLVERERTQRELAVSHLADTLAHSSGMYITVGAQPGGSSVWYMHNKPTLAESDIVWKLTAEAFGISTDGGKTYPYGFTVTGEMITRLLYAEGINADYIDTGAITVRDKSGGVIFSVDMDTGALHALKANITGSITASSGTIGGFNITNTPGSGGTSAAGGHAYASSLYCHTSDGEYEYEAGLKGSADYGNASFYIRRIGKGAAWNTGELLYYVTNNGLLYAQNADITGKITATSGSFTGEITAGTGKIGGWNITASKISAGDAKTGVAAMQIPSENTSTVFAAGGTSHSSYADCPFLVTKDGSLTATKATITGVITATSGKLGGWTLTGTQLYNGTITSNASGNFGISTENFTRTVAGASRTDLRLAIGSNFGVSASGVLYAASANITGTITATSGSFKGAITATSGNIGGFSITGTSNTGTSAAGGHAYASSLYCHTSDDNYEYEAGLKGSADYGNASFYIRRIGKGAAWNTGELLYYVTNNGHLYAQNADITGKITATSGAIGGWTLTGTQLYNGTITSNASGNFGMSTADFTRTVAGESHSDLRLAIGSNFGVSKSGAVYCSALAAQGYIVGGSWKSGQNSAGLFNTTVFLNDLGLCIAQKSHRSGGRYYGMILTLSPGHALQAIPAMYDDSTDTWYVQSASTTLASWSGSDAGGTGSSGGSRAVTPGDISGSF